MLYALKTWWVRAIAAPFVELYVQPTALVMGVAIAAVLSITVAYGVLRRLLRASPTALLRGRIEAVSNQSARGHGGVDSRAHKGRRGRWSTRVGWSLVLVAGIVAIAGSRMDGMGQAGAFFASGAAVLAGLLTLMRSRLGTSESASLTVSSFARLRASSAARNPGRSVLTVGLVASACFLIIAMAAFRLQPTSVGTGGFQLVARSDRPIFEDLGNADERAEVLGEAYRDETIVSLRLKSGDDASCRNLFQVGRPTLIGLTPQFLAHARKTADGFGWAAAPRDVDTPWECLAAASDPEQPIAVVLDQNTAMYSLHLRGKIGEEFELPFDPPLRFRTVGLLSNSVLQGKLIVSESDLLAQFPDVAGYRYFLGGRVGPDGKNLAGVLEKRFGDEGLDVRDAQATLDNLLAVQNTYLTTFQSLGSLGLLLGTVGLAFVQLRNVAERRGELALMQTMGFSRDRLGALVMGETLWLIVAGLAIGVVSAAVTVVPHLLAGAARPPWLALAGMLLAILLCGLLASQLAVRWARQTPILQTLRRDI